jgi:hypothetical protein
MNVGDERITWALGKQSKNIPLPFRFTPTILLGRYSIDEGLGLSPAIVLGKFSANSSLGVSKAILALSLSIVPWGRDREGASSLPRRPTPKYDRLGSTGTARIRIEYPILLPYYNREGSTGIVCIGTRCRASPPYMIGGVIPEPKISEQRALPLSHDR